MATAIKLNEENCLELNNLKTELISIANEFIRDNNIEDKGTCVIGSGICIYAIHKGKRSSKRRYLYVAPFQGNISQQLVYNYLYKVLREQNNKYYEHILICDGSMD